MLKIRGVMHEGVAALVAAAIIVGVAAISIRLRDVESADLIEPLKSSVEKRASSPPLAPDLAEIDSWLIPTGPVDDRAEPNIEREIAQATILLSASQGLEQWPAWALKASPAAGSVLSSGMGYWLLSRRRAENVTLEVASHFEGRIAPYILASRSDVQSRPGASKSLLGGISPPSVISGRYWQGRLRYPLNDGAQGLVLARIEPWQQIYVTATGSGADESLKKRAFRTALDASVVTILLAAFGAGFVHAVFLRRAPALIYSLYALSCAIFCLAYAGWLPTAELHPLTQGSKVDSLVSCVAVAMMNLTSSIFLRLFFSTAASMPRTTALLRSVTGAAIGILLVMPLLSPIERVEATLIVTAFALIAEFPLMLRGLSRGSEIGLRVYSVRWILSFPIFAGISLEMQFGGNVGVLSGILPELFILSEALFLGAALVARSGVAIRLARALEVRLAHERNVAAHAQRLASLGRVAGGVAHEISTPLMGVQTYIQLLREVLGAHAPHAAASADGEPQAGTGEEREHSLREAGEMAALGLRSAEESLAHIAGIIQGLRVFSHKDADDEAAAWELSALVDRATALSAQRLELAGTSLATRSLAGVVITCRPAQIVQILHVLITNAADAMDDLRRRDGAGAVTWIEVDARMSSHSEGTTSVEIRVSDAGGGIPQEIAQHLMEPFFTTKEVGSGTGLGLSIAYGIAQAHGGTLALDREAANTTFVLTLPATFSSAWFGASDEKRRGKDAGRGPRPGLAKDDLKAESAVAPKREAA